MDGCPYFFLKAGMTNEPQEFRAGDTITWTKDWSSDGYSAADGWAAKFIFYGPAKVEVEGTASGSSFIFTLPSETSASMTPGVYALVGQVSKDGTVYTVFDGKATVTADPSKQTTAVDVRSKAQIICENIETWWATTNPDCAQALNALGFNVQYMSPEAIQKVYGYWKRKWNNEIAADRVKRGKPSGKNYLLRFG